jgi:hypothetical protein
MLSEKMAAVYEGVSIRTADVIKMAHEDPGDLPDDDC